MRLCAADSAGSNRSANQAHGLPSVGPSRAASRAFPRAVAPSADQEDWPVIAVAHCGEKTYILDQPRRQTAQGANGYEHRNRTWMGSALVRFNEEFETIYDLVLQLAKSVGADAVSALAR